MIRYIIHFALLLFCILLCVMGYVTRKDAFWGAALLVAVLAAVETFINDDKK